VKVHVKAFSGVHYVWTEAGGFNGPDCRSFPFRRDALRHAETLGGEVEAEIETSLPWPLVKRLKERLHAAYFVETGTAWGDGTESVVERFERIWTIELSSPQYAAASRRLSPYGHVTCLFGPSPDCLREIVPLLNRPTIFWLDGHYSGPGTACHDHECPVLQELEALRDLSGPHAILIDDARLFGTTPPPPHAQYWPSVEEVRAALPWPAELSLSDDQIVIEKP
jgi:hypothetical protein